MDALNDPEDFVGLKGKEKDGGGNLLEASLLHEIDSNQCSGQPVRSQRTNNGERCSMQEESPGKDG